MTDRIRKISAAGAISCVLAVLFATSAACAAPAAGANAELRAKVAQLEARLQRQEDIEAVRRLAFSYGDYMDNALISEVTSLFSNKIEYCELSGYGYYKGLAGCLKIWNEILAPSMQNADGHMRFGRLLKHYLVKDIITIGPDGRTAEGRFDYVGYSGVWGQPGTQQLGVYRIGFVKEGEVWKIGRFNLSFDTSDWNDNLWPEKTQVRCPRADAPKPDGPPMLYHPFPESAVIPFNEPNPVTGKAIPSYVNPKRYWRSGWPGEDPRVACGGIPNASGTMEPSRGSLRSAP